MPIDSIARENFLLRQCMYSENKTSQHNVLSDISFISQDFNITV